MYILIQDANCKDSYFFYSNQYFLKYKARNNI